VIVAVSVTRSPSFGFELVATTFVTWRSTVGGGVAVGGIGVGVAVGGGFVGVAVGRSLRQPGELGDASASGPPACLAYEMCVDVSPLSA
jgi:hypothetical protein